jgi:hypothetical protein
VFDSAFLTVYTPIECGVVRNPGFESFPLDRMSILPQLPDAKFKNLDLNLLFAQHSSSKSARRTTSTAAVVMTEAKSGVVAAETYHCGTEALDKSGSSTDAGWMRTFRAETEAIHTTNAGEPRATTEPSPRPLSSESADLHADQKTKKTNNNCCVM